MTRRILLIVLLLGLLALPAGAQYSPIPNFSGPNAGLSFRNALNNKLSGTDTVTPRIASINFAQLASTPATNGQMYYVTDATQSTPCASGGSGALAVAIAGIWSCAGGAGMTPATLSPAIGGGQNTFTTVPSFTGTGVIIFYNGTLLNQGLQSAGGQYTVSNGTIVFNADAIPQTDSNIQVYIAGSGSGGSGAGGGVSAVNAAPPLLSSGGTTPTISLNGVTGAQGNGSKVQLSTGNAIPGSCVQYDANGNATNANGGAPCGTGGSGSNIASYTGPVSISATGGTGISGAAVTAPSLTVTGMSTFNNTATLNNGLMVSSGYADQPNNSNAYTGSTIGCLNTQNDFILSADSIITLNCVDNFDHTMYFRLFQPATGSTFAWSFLGANGAKVLPSSGTMPTACTNNGCANQERVDYIALTNTYLVTEVGGNYGGGSAGGGSSTCPTGQTCYYVANAGDTPAGSDSNAGTSAAAPWLTVAKVNSILSTLNPGDEVLFKRGDTWTAQTLTMGDTAAHHVNGTAALPIIIGTYGTTGQAIFDENNVNNYCFNAITQTTNAVTHVTLDNFECKHAKLQAVTFQGFHGNMPGITVSNFYIHDNGPGCATSSTACLGTSVSYNNQLDFQDSGFSSGSNPSDNDGVHFLNNIVKWNGGWNCIEVHGDTGAFLVQGNTAGPGCPHEIFDVKMGGNASNVGTIKNNVCIAGANESLMGTNSACFYAENPWNQNTNLLYQGNLAYDMVVGAQFCPGGTPSGFTSGGSLKYYNNTFYANATANPGGNSNGYWPSLTCNGSNAGTANKYALDLRNNIFDGSAAGAAFTLFVATNTFSPCTEDYNNVGGSLGLSAVQSCGGLNGTHDQNSVNPLYVNPAAGNFQLQPGSPDINAGFIGLTPSNNNIGAF